MRDLLASLCDWHRRGIPFGLATVVSSTAGLPAPGDLMAVDPAGEVRGGIPAGCVESAVLDAAAEVLRTGRPRLARYAVGADGPWPSRPGCDGTLSVLVRRVAPGDAAGRVLCALAGGGPVAVATVTGGPAPFAAQLVIRPDRLDGTLGDPVLDHWAGEAGEAADLFGAGGTVLLRRAGRPPVRVLLQVVPAAPGMLLVGGTAVAAALSRIGVDLGYRVTVCDPRPAFVSAGRFPYAHEVHRAWPHRWLPTVPVDTSTVLCLLGHDPRHELALLRAALDTPAGYIGVLGSRAAHAARVERLRGEGVPEAQLNRLAAPAGLDLNGRTPAEIALAIAAELVAVRRGGSGRPLAGLTGPIRRTGLPGPPRRAAGRR
ncbi:XdhC family protein [Micromonospora sp. NPDC050200]|uniref:XdhC family protein n=1 Tax=Micromonospora sp. NPDC050200 TaxID=3155664 RepID=UPI00340497C4